MFGGLYQEHFLCKCGPKAEMPLKNLPNIIPIHLSDISVQTCLENFLAKEEIERNCENCDSQHCLKTMSIIIEPTTLILLLIRYKFDQTTNETIKVQNPVNCEKYLVLPSGTIYTLNSTIFFNFLIFIACSVFYRRKYESGLRIAGSGSVLLLIQGFRFVDRFSVLRCMASLSLIMVFFLRPAPN